MSQEEPVSLETVKAILDAFNAHDLDAVMDFFVKGRPQGLILEADRSAAVASAAFATACPTQQAGFDVPAEWHRPGAREEEKSVKYMIMLYASQQDFDAMSGKDTGKPAWSAEQLGAMGAFMASWNDELVESGEFVDARGLAAPVHSRRLGSKDGVAYVTDGPYAEAQEVLAGYTIVECESFDKASEIAARLSNCPPGPSPDGQYVDVRSIMEGFEELHG